MTDKFVLVSQADGIATIALNRAEKRNAMNGQLVEELSRTLHMLADDPQSRVLLIYGIGDHFCAGADIAWMQNIATSTYAENYLDAQKLSDLMYQLYTFPKPTIVLAHGATLGGGLGLLAASDIAIAAQNTTFGFPEVKIGIAPSIVSPYVLAALGERAAHYYFLTGERFGAEEALKLGLIHQMTENNKLIDSGMMIAKSLLQNSPSAMGAAKKLIRNVSKEKISQELTQEMAKHLAELRASSEAQEGLHAFLEKRNAKWPSFNSLPPRHPERSEGSHE